jgi:hypothetical protein
VQVLCARRARVVMTCFLLGPRRCRLAALQERRPARDAGRAATRRRAFWHTAANSTWAAFVHREDFTPSELSSLSGSFSIRSRRTLSVGVFLSSVDSILNASDSSSMFSSSADDAHCVANDDVRHS